MGDFADLRLTCAAKVPALADALRNITSELAPCRRASLVALREQVYYGWEQPLSRARSAQLIFGKYEVDGWWSDAAAYLVHSGAAVKGTRQLERDHVEPVSRIVADLLEVQRSPAEMAALLDDRLVTCTVLTEEHRRLGRAQGAGWARYDAIGIRYRYGLRPEALVWDERNGPDDSMPELDTPAFAGSPQAQRLPRLCPDETASLRTRGWSSVDLGGLADDWAGLADIAVPRIAPRVCTRSLRAPPRHRLGLGWDCCAPVRRTGS